RLQLLRNLHSCSGCFRLERLPGGTCTHWKAPPYHGAHPLQTFAEESCCKRERHNPLDLRLFDHRVGTDDCQMLGSMLSVWSSGNPPTNAAFLLFSSWNPGRLHVGTPGRLAIVTGGATRF